MAEKKQMPVVRLELNAGLFRIPTVDAVFEITVAASGGLPQIIENIVEREVAAEKPPLPQPPRPEPLLQGAPSPAGDTFYKDISEEMYQEVGRLARQLSISIKTPLTGADLNNVDLGQAGIDLESAKGQLQSIVQMTEKATMDIMDVSEDIQDNCDVIKKNLATLKSLECVGGAAQQPEPGQSGTPAAGIDIFENLLDREKRLQELLALLPTQPPSSAAAAAAPEKATLYRFSLDGVFQTLYELCTNETVKKNHIRPMREAQETAFDGPAVLKAFSALASTVPVEETFYQFPLPGILKILFQHCTVENFRQTLKKMNQSAATIFLDQTLPLEGAAEEVDAPAAQPPDAPSADDGLAHLTGLVDETISLLRAEIDRLRAQGTSAAPGFISMRADDHAQLVDAIASTDAVLQRIIANIRRILEALTFQDLSGQRIKKILGMLSNVQVQLLSILVSFGVKLKKKQEEKDITPDETQKFADREVDRVKNLVAEQPVEGETWEGPLNQDAVDKLLGDLGF